MLRLGLPEQAMGCYPLGLGLVVEDKSFMYINFMIRISDILL